VGYAGGTKKDPSYFDLGDHTETMQLDFDPAHISYEALLKVFWAAHDPAVKCSSKQYKPVIFYHDAAQKKLAEQTRAAEAARLGREVQTEILPATTFYMAEDYHQKYYLRSTPDLLQEMRHHYPRDADLVRSTAAARLNGYAGGYGTLAGLQAEIDSLGLSPRGRARLTALVKSR
jgi:methionine-S-sulfoxide reductase